MKQFNLVWFPTMPVSTFIKKIGDCELTTATNCSHLSGAGIGCIVELNGVEYFVMSKPTERGVVLTDSNSETYTAESAPESICSIVLFGRRPGKPS